MIVSHVDAYGYEEDAVVNEASLRASRILPLRFCASSKPVPEK
ncbi:hypothetical protein [Parabacteroides goldsteinii]|nr:hypothetical protein [Parabacteroides goldsteinii]